MTSRLLPCVRAKAQTVACRRRALDRIDQAREMITVDRQVIIVDRRPVLAPPKTSASLRDVPMPRFVRQAVTDLADRLGTGPHDVLCCTPRGTLLRRDCYNREIWKPAIAAADLPTETTFMTCGTRSPARRSRKACPSPRSPAGSATSRSPRPWTCTDTWSPKQAAGLVTPWTRRSRPVAKLCEPRRAQPPAPRLRSQGRSLPARTLSTPG